MATITLSSPVFFQNGVGGVSAVVGYADRTNRVARYSFTAPQSGASSVSLALTGLVYGDGTRPQTLRFYIGTDPNSHTSAGASAACTGILNIGTDKVSFTGSANVLLLPNTVYYLFLFPNSTEYGWFSLELATAVLTTAGGSCSVPTLSENTAVMGQALTIHTNRHSSDFTHTVTYVFGNASGTIAEGVTDSCTWTPPLELARQIPNAALGVGSIYCTTYSGSTQIGSPQPVTVYLAVPEDVVPTAALSITDSSEAYDKLGTYVQNVTRLSVSVTGTGAYGSTLTATALTLDGSPYSGGVITSAGSHTLTATVTDSRGRRGTASQSFTVAAYEKPALTLTASRCDADGNADDTGEYCRVSVTGSTAQVNGRNRAELSLTYGSTAKPIAVEVGAFSHAEILPAPSTETLALSAVLSDALLTASRSMTLSVGYATMDFLKGGKGIAFGATATKEGFTCAMDAYFSGGLYTLTGDGEQEWLFPPMEPGVVYRTAERFMGKPVYIACVEFGALPNGSKTVVLPHTYSSRFISVTGTFGNFGNYNGSVYNDEYPLVLGGGITQIHPAQRGDHTHIVINTDTDMSGYTAVLTLKFIR